MIAIKGVYENGQIKIYGKIPSHIKKAKLTIVIEPEGTEKEVSITESEYDFRMLGLYNFFSTEDDKEIDWEEFFGLK
ncbi:MAG: hypothetical protein OD816_001263 [Thermodesulfobacterium sp.]|uniref:Uncharacterized protein n=1 Tax=Candidatus Thermodesulfobacterium syntrophicum TaxID=3060442 RepID=A0AAE3P5S6_9BACT|nr:hypothetical protein [Candidatus Thermodesulfobacterium syntrophicum]